MTDISIEIPTSRTRTTPCPFTTLAPPLALNASTSAISKSTSNSNEDSEGPMASVILPSALAKPKKLTTPCIESKKPRLTVEPPKGWSSVVVLSSNIAETLKFRPRELPNFASSSTSKRAIKPLLSILNPLSIRVSLPIPASSRLPFTISSILAAESLNSTAPLISN